MEKHRITNANRQSLLGDCSICGLQVAVVWNQSMRHYYCRWKANTSSNERYAKSVGGLKNSPAHKLTEVLADFCIGTCSVCGPDIEIGVYDGYWKCMQGRQETKIVHRYGQAALEAWREKTVCECCGSAEELSIDHCHEKNTYRGILCKLCNAGLGQFKDDPALLKLAIEYLETR